MREPFEALYEQYVGEVMRPTEARVQAAFREWKQEGYGTDHRRGDGATALPRPTQRVRTRIKRPEAVLKSFSGLRTSSRTVRRWTACR